MHYRLTIGNSYCYYWRAGKAASELVLTKYAHKLNEARDVPKEERGNCKVITGFIIYIYMGLAIFLVANHRYAPQSGPCCARIS